MIQFLFKLFEDALALSLNGSYVIEFSLEGISIFDELADFIKEDI